MNLISRFPLMFFSHTCSRTSGISGMGFLWSGCPSCHPTIGVKALKGTQSTDPNHWPGLIFFSSTTGLLAEGALLPLRRLFEVSIIITARSELRKVLFLAPSVCFVFVYEISPGTAERIWTKFTRTTCLVPRSDEFEGQG